MLRAFRYLKRYITQQKQMRQTFREMLSQHEPLDNTTFAAIIFRMLQQYIYSPRNDKCVDIRAFKEDDTGFM